MKEFKKEHERRKPSSRSRVSSTKVEAPPLTLARIVTIFLRRHSSSFRSISFEASVTPVKLASGGNAPLEKHRAAACRCSEAPVDVVTRDKKRINSREQLSNVLKSSRIYKNIEQLQPNNLKMNKSHCIFHIDKRESLKLSSNVQNIYIGAV